MEVYRLGPGGGTILELLHVTSEPVSGPEVANKAFLYFLKDSGFRVKLFGQDGEPLTEANVSVLLQDQTSAPVPVAGHGQLYAKTVGGKVQLHYIADDGTVFQISPPITASDILTAVGVETAARVAAVSSEATARAAADTSETSARVAADLTKVTKGGDTDAAAVVVGTRDAQDFKIKTQDIVRLLIDKANGRQAVGDPSVATPAALHHLMGLADGDVSARTMLARIAQITDAFIGSMGVVDQFKAKNAANAYKVYSQLLQSAIIGAPGGECGNWNLSLMKAGILSTILNLNADVLLATLTLTLDMNYHNVINVADPVNPQDADTKNARDVAIAAAVSAGAGELILVEQKTLVAAAQDVTFSGLNGDVDGTYVLVATLPSQVFGMSMFLQPNGDGTHGNTGYIRQKTASLTSGGGSGIIQIGGRENGGGFVDVEMVFHAAQSLTLKDRIGQSSSIESFGGAMTTYQFFFGYPPTGNITSLVLHGDVAAAFATSSVFTLYKRKHG